MSDVETRSLPVHEPLDLRATLRPLHGRFRDDGWWLTARTSDGPASLRVRRTRTEVVGEAWGEGAGILLGRLHFISGLEDDPSGFQPEDGVVADLHRAHPGWRFGRTGHVFDSLLVSICGQKVTGQEAAAAMTGLYGRFGDPAPGPDASLRLPPDPDRMAEAPYFEFHHLHLEKRRADVIRAVSAKAGQIEALAGQTPEQAAAVLHRFPGIATWTSAKTLEISHGDADQVAVGDYHFKHMVVHHLTGRDRGTDDEMIDLLERYRPHRGRVIRLLHLLGHEPSFGPRLAARDITKM